MGSTSFQNLEDTDDEMRASVLVEPRGEEMQRRRGERDGREPSGLDDYIVLFVI